MSCLRLRSNASAWMLIIGALSAASCSGAAGDLFPPGVGGDDSAAGGTASGRGGASPGLGGAAAGSRGGSAGSDPIANGGSASSGGSTVVGVGASQGLGGDEGGSSGGAGGAGGSGNEADAGAAPVEPPVLPPECAACSCSTARFGEPERVGGLDTGVPTFGPAPSADGLTLFLSTIDGTEDISFATRSTRGNQFLSPLPVAGVNGTDTEEGTPFISADDRSLFFFSTRPDPGAVGDRDLWVATRTDGSAAFSEPSLVPDVNSADIEHLPRLTPDGLTLIFVSGRDSPNLGSNLWQARRESLGQPFGQAVELPGVNSNARDEGFWLSADGRTIFFASNRLVQADMDIWVATRADVDSAFGEAQNLDLVNTTDQELDPALTLDGFELFFASDRSGTMQLYRSARQCD